MQQQPQKRVKDEFDVEALMDEISQLEALIEERKNLMAGTVNPIMKVNKNYNYLHLLSSLLVN